MCLPESSKVSSEVFFFAGFFILPDVARRGRCRQTLESAEKEKMGVRASRASDVPLRSLVASTSGQVPFFFLESEATLLPCSWLYVCLSVYELCAGMCVCMHARMYIA